MIKYELLNQNQTQAENRIYDYVEAIDREVGKDRETRDLQYKRMNVYSKQVAKDIYICIFEFCSQGASPDEVYEVYAPDLHDQVFDRIISLGYDGFFLLAYSRDNMREKYYYDLSLPYSYEPIRYDEEVFDID